MIATEGLSRLLVSRQLAAVGVLFSFGCSLAACQGPRTTDPSSSPSKSDGSPRAVVLRDVNVVTMDSDRVLPSQTVVVEGERIAAVERSSEVSVPAGAQFIEGRGAYLMPGLADMHVHLEEEPDLLLFLANGVTSVRNMSGAPFHLAWREEIVAGERLGPTLYTTGPVIDGPVVQFPGNAAPPLAPDRFVVVETKSAAAAAVAEHREAGYDFIKVYDNLPLEAFQGVVEAADRFDIPVVGHVPFGAGLEASLAAPLTSIEHLRGYIYELLPDSAPFELGWDKRSRFMAWNFIATDRFQGLARATLEAGVWNVPTLTRYQKNMLPTPAHIERYSSAEAQYLAAPIRERMLAGRSAEAHRYRAFSEADLEAGIRVFAAKKSFVRALHRAGARLLLGSDDWLAGFATIQELRNLVDAGLTPYEALLTGTRSAAEFLGGKDEFGTVTVGKRADLILLDANPLEGVENITRRLGVMVRGRWLPEAELQRRLDNLLAQRQ